ncbi:hypothetical protein [Scytonema sp. PCC 10023]|uniref:hypothetical protein n=1 Tax=Scytonema sp. PCC 10023 TaxID=1680591 RepID=UPI0039C66F66
MKIEEPNMVSLSKPKISRGELSEFSELSNDELLELSDEELLQIAGGGWLDDVLKVITTLEPIVVPLITG